MPKHSTPEWQPTSTHSISAAVQMAVRKTLLHRKRRANQLMKTPCVHLWEGFVLRGHERYRIVVCMIYASLVHISSVPHPVSAHA